MWSDIVVHKHIGDQEDMRVKDRERHKPNKWSGSILKNFTISYIVVFMLPLLFIFAVFYHNGMAIVKDEIHDAHIAMVNQFKNSMDEQLYQIKTITNLLDNNVELQKLMSTREGEIDAQIQFDVMQIRKSMLFYKSSNSFIDSIYIYIDSLDRCITGYNFTSSSYTFEQFHGNKMEQLDYSQWKSFMKGVHKGSLINIPYLSKTDNQTFNNLYYIQSLPLLQYDSSQATVVYRFRKQNIKKTINTELLSEKTIIGMIDNKSNLLLTSSDNLPIEINYGIFSDDESYITYEKHIITYVKSSQSPAIFFSIIPEADILSDLYRMQKISFMILAVCIILGAILTYLFTIRNYNPIKQLLHITKLLNTAENDDKKRDAYSQIQHALLEALDQKVISENQQIVKVQKQKEQKLYGLLTDDPVDPKKIKIILAEYDIAFNRKHFYVIKIILSDFSSGFFDQKINVDDLTLPLSVSRSVYEEMISSSDNSVLAFTREKTISLLINTDQKSKEYFEKIKKIISTAQKFIRDNYVVDTYATISDIHCGIESIKDAFKEADETMHYFEIIGKNEIVPYRDITKQDSEGGLKRFVIKEKQILIGSIRSGEFAHAKDTLHLIFEKYFYGELYSPQLILYRLFSLVGDVMDALVDLDIPYKDNIIEQLQPFNNVQDLHVKLVSILDDASIQYVNNEENRDYDLKREIVEIVQENYTNPDLNVSFIANLLDMNLDYISKTFKKTSLIGLLDYIHHTRISAAKKMLRQKQSVTIQEIASIVGYTNSDTFIRAFKRREGMTPGKYRTLSSK